MICDTLAVDMAFLTEPLFDSKHESSLAQAIWVKSLLLSCPAGVGNPSTCDMAANVVAAPGFAAQAAALHPNDLHPAHPAKGAIITLSLSL